MAKSDPMTLGETLREFRDRSGIGPIKLACKILGVSHGSLGSYELGHTLPDVDFLAKFAEVTGASFIELLKLRLAASGAPESLRAIQLLEPASRGGDGAASPEKIQVVAEAARDVDQELLIEISAKLLKKRLESADFGLAAVRFYAEHQAAIREALQAVREGKVQESEAFVPLVQKLQPRLMQMAVMHAAFVAIIYNEVVRMGSQAARTRGIDERAKSYAGMLGRALGPDDGKDQPFG